MSLDNLVGISLEKIKPDSASIARLLAATRRNIADATIMAVSSENRFDAAYKAIMQLANGFRTLTSKASPEFTYSTGNPGRYLRASSHFKQP